MMKKKKETILGRDLFGIKPLYFSSFDEGIIFSSEIHSIKKINLQKVEYISESASWSFFKFNIVQEKKQFLKKFKE